MGRCSLHLFASTKIKHCRNLRLGPQFCEVFDAHLACCFRKVYALSIIREIYLVIILPSCCIILFFVLINTLMSGVSRDE
jgi:hypothetical protein